MAEIGIVDLLGLCGFPSGVKAKLVRHQDKTKDVRQLIRRGWFDAYQSFQAQRVFDNVDYVVSCVGAGGCFARFVGVYKVEGRQAANEVALPIGCPYENWRDPTRFFYRLVKQPGFESLEERVEIDWGIGALAWHQLLRNKPVHRIIPKGQQLEVFADYLDFALTYSELRHLVLNEDANSEWRDRLSMVAGVYLILDTVTGQQYVGSATGKGGIWHRWSEYARTGHGGNAGLKRLIKAHPKTHPAAFRYSILQFLPASAVRAEVTGLEDRMKDKLGSRVTGINDN